MGNIVRTLRDVMASLVVCLLCAPTCLAVHVYIQKMEFAAAPGEGHHGELQIALARPASYPGLQPMTSCPGSTPGGTLDEDVD